MCRPSEAETICCCPAHHGQGRLYRTENGMWSHIGQDIGAREPGRLPQSCEHGIPYPRTRGFTIRLNVRERRLSSVGRGSINE